MNEHDTAMWRKNNILYFEIPKNMSTSVREEIEKHKGWEKLGDYNNNKLPKDHKKCWKFTILRNPMQRFVSAYLQITPPAKDEDREDINEFFRVLGKLEVGDFFNSHLIPQCRCLPCEMDFYATTGNIEEDWKMIKKKTGLDYPEKRLNVKVKEDKQKVNQWIDGRIYSTIRRIYKKDFDLYNKQFE